MGQARGRVDDALSASNPDLAGADECFSSKAKTAVDPLGTLCADPYIRSHSVGQKEEGALRRGATTAADAALTDMELSLELAHPDPAERRAHLETLARQRTIPAAYAPAIAAVLNDTHWTVRCAAAQALACCRDAAAAHLPKLVACLDDEEWPVRSSAAEALGELCMVIALSPEELAEIGMALTKHLGDDHEDVRRAASEALASLGAPAAAELALNLLHSRDAEARRCVAEMLGRLAADSPEVAANVAVPLARCLQDPDTCVRNTAAASLVQCGHSAVSAVAPLLSASGDTDFMLQAIDVLGALDASDPSLAKLLADTFVGCLRDADCDVRRAATEALSSLSPDVIEPHASKLAALLGDSEIEVAQAAATGLGHLGNISVLYTPQLIECMCSRDSSVHKAVLTALDRAGAGVGEYAAQCLRDERAEVRSAAAGVLRHLHSSGTCAATLYIEELSACLDDSDSRVLLAVIGVLSRIGVAALSPSLEKLEGLLECSDQAVRLAAVEALRGCSLDGGGSMSSSQNRVSVLVKRVRVDGSPEVRLAAANLLLEGSPEKLTMHKAEFAARLTDTDERVRRAVLLALGKSGLASSPHVLGVVSRLEDECPAVREAAAVALGGLGPDGAVYAEVLGRCACEDSSDSVRAAAADALQSVLALGAESGQAGDHDDDVDSWGDLDLGDDLLPI